MWLSSIALVPLTDPDAGLGLRAPWPIEKHEIVDVSEVRRVETGKVGC